MTVKHYRVMTFGQFQNVKRNKGFIKVIINAKNKELKNAILMYSESSAKAVTIVIGEAIQKMVDSKDYTISIFQGHDESAVSGIDTRENILSRQISLDFDPGIINSVDKIIMRLNTENPKNKITRRLFVQEAIKRYLEPELIRLNYLPASVFKDKLVAAKNLRTFRKSLKNISRAKFIENFLSRDGKPQISFPQYTVIETTGKGNIDRILDLVVESFDFALEKDVFYEPEVIFKSRLENL